MATTVTETIGSGGDHATISDWLSATASDLVSADEIRVGEIIDAAAFDEASTIDVTGATTDADRYRHLTVAEGVRHNGTGDGSGARYPYTGGGHAFTINEAHFHVSWLDFSYPSGGGSSDEIARIFETGVTFENCLFHDVPHEDGDALYAGSGGIEIFTANCLFWNIARMACHVQGQQNLTWYVYNCTGWDCAKNHSGTAGSNYGVYGFGSFADNSGSVMVCKNCYAGQSNDGHADFTDGSGSATGTAGNFTGSENNISEDSSAPGSNSQTGVAPSGEFQSLSGTIDLHLADGSALIDAGTDLSADADFPVSGDIDGDARGQGQGWDVGGDEVVVVATAGALAPGFGMELIQ